MLPVSQGNGQGEPREWRLSDGRAEPRSFCNGEVRIVLNMEEPREFVGELMDISNHGFRAAHHFTGIVAGCDVQFDHRIFRGRARVAWTRTFSDRIETGFQVIRD